MASSQDRPDNEDPLAPMANLPLPEERSAEDTMFKILQQIQMNQLKYGASVPPRSANSGAPGGFSLPGKSYFGASGATKPAALPLTATPFNPATTPGAFGATQAAGAGASTGASTGAYDKLLKLLGGGGGNQYIDYGLKAAQMLMALFAGGGNDYSNLVDESSPLARYANPAPTTAFSNKAAANLGLGLARRLGNPTTVTGSGNAPDVTRPGLDTAVNGQVPLDQLINNYLSGASDQDVYGPPPSNAVPRLRRRGGGAQGE